MAFLIGHSPPADPQKFSNRRVFHIQVPEAAAAKATWAAHSMTAIKKGDSLGLGASQFFTRSSGSYILFKASSREHLGSIVSEVGKSALRRSQD